MSKHAQGASAPVVFSYATRYEIRVFVVEGAPWFVANDVCAALGLAHPASKLRRLGDDEKGVCTMATTGGPQEMAIVSESGLYSLVLASGKPEAKRFRMWVASEVLPTLRRTGSYVHQLGQSQPILLGEIAQWVVGEYTRSLGRYLSYSNQQISPRLHTHLRARFGVCNVRDIPADRLGDLLALLEDFHRQTCQLWRVCLELETALLQTLYATVGEDRHELPPAIRQAMTAVAKPETGEGRMLAAIRDKAYRRLAALAPSPQ